MTGVDGFDVVEEELLDEKVCLAVTSKGLRVRVVPTDRFREAAAMVVFRYGSTDLGFDLGERQHHSPEGVAHYLEHKLFEDPSIKVFDRFARRGARVNAMTGFTKTSYHFSATSQVQENLQDLLHLVSHAHVTKENVDKERGIIAQEIRMYEDSADYRLFFDYLGCLYESHPVRHPVGGTVESIQQITTADLLECYAAFYRTGNAALAVAGPVDAAEILELAERCELPEGAPPRSLSTEDLGSVKRGVHERSLQLPRTKVMLGCKDRDLLQDPEDRLRRQLVMELLLDRLLSASSEIREGLRKRGIIDDSLSSTYVQDLSFGFSSISLETDEPERVVDALRDVLFTPVSIDEDYLERVRRKMLGKYVRSFASVHGLAVAQAHEALEDVRPFGAMARLQSVTAEDVEARQRAHFQQDSFAVAVVRRQGES